MDEGQIRTEIAKHIPDAVRDIGVNDDLIEFGLNSMAMINIASHWRRKGFDINFAGLAAQPTIAAWLNRLGSSIDGAPASGGLYRTAEVPPADRATFPLATMQHAYWVGRRSEQSLGGVAAHLYAEFDGREVDPEQLRIAVNALIVRHEMLRARFLPSGQQEILEALQHDPLSINALRNSDQTGIELLLESLREEKSHQLLDVGAGQVIDFTLSLLPGGRTRLHVDVDMLAADAMSYRTLMSDLADFYHNEGENLSPLRYQYRDYLRDKNNVNADEYAREREWWRARLGELPDPPELPLVPEARRANPHLTTRRNYHVSPEQKAILLKESHRRGITPAVVLASIFAEVVGRWSTSQKFLLNLPLFNREPFHDDVASLAGDFSSSVMVPIDTSQPRPFIQLAHEVQKSLHTVADHSAYPGLDVIRDLGRYRGEAVLAPVVYTSGLDLGELFAEKVIATFGDPVWIVSQGPQVVLDAQVVELRGGLLVNWDVREDAFYPGVIDAMFARYSAGLDRLLSPEADWSLALDDRLTAGQERRRADTNFTRAPRSQRLLHQCFFDTAQSSPESPALVHHRDDRIQALSYRDVSEQARRIAYGLRAAGVGPGDVVSVRIPKGPEQIVAVLGIMAAGAVYLPIGSDQPAARRRKMEAVAAVRLSIVHGDTSSHGDDIPALTFDSLLENPPCDLPITLGNDKDIAYILFTSGSTGIPKGVPVSHGAVMNTLERCRDQFGLQASDRSIALSALEFDLSIEETFGLFDVGGSVVIIDEDTRRDGHRISELVGQLSVTQLYCVPGILDMILSAAEQTDRLRTVRTVVVGGDRVDVSLARRVFSCAGDDVVFAGLGGCTEAAIHHSMCVVPRDIPDDWTTVPLGVPLANMGARVVADSGLDCPDWVPGELWVSGAGLAEGYLGDPERTAERFVTYDEKRWYRTGDLVRYRGDGRIEFLGRIDNQVKLRGYRIEPGEIENVMRSIDGVRDAVVAVVDRRGASRLSAVIVTEPSRSDEIVTQTRGKLLDLLPSYMIPEQIEAVEYVPLTSNGKVDHRAVVSTLNELYSSEDYVEPSDSLEQALALIIGDVLAVDRVGAEDDFFLIGGDSVRGTTAVARIMEGLDTDEVSVGDLFVGRNIRGLAARLQNRATDPQRLMAVAEIYCEVFTMTDEQLADAAKAIGE